MTNSIERAKAHAAEMYPEAEVSTRNVRGRPVVLAQAGNLIQFVRPEDVPEGQAAPLARLSVPIEKQRSN